jgi:hypothetical protein
MVKLRIIYRLVIVTAIVIVAAVLPAGQIEIDSEAMRVTPQKYSSTISLAGSRRVGGTSWNTSSKLRVSFLFSLHQRPRTYSDVFTTGPAASGVAVTLDQYANLYLRLGTISGGEDAYSLMFLSSPVTLNTWYEIDITVGGSNNQVLVFLNSKKLPLNEARPGRAFVVTRERLLTGEIVLGGKGLHTFLGEIRDFTITAADTNSRVDTKILRILIILSLATVLTRWFVYSSRTKVSRARTRTPEDAPDNSRIKQGILRRRVGHLDEKTT